MKRYEHGDNAKFYFVIKKIRDKEKYVKGWTDNKELLKYYMDFHDSKNLYVKKITGSIDVIRKILEENNNDEITIGQIRIGDKRGEEKMVALPITETEMQFIREEENSFMSTSINYSLINEMLPCLKKKYQNAIKKIFLGNITNFLINNKYNDIVGRLFLNNIKILYRSFPEEF